MDAKWLEARTRYGIANVDHLSASARSENMARVRGKDTTPEIVVRKLLHRMGRRFRLHRNDLPGTPDIVLPGSRQVIFVNGCFWHRHEGCCRTTTPGTRVEFWEKKFAATVARDARNRGALEAAGWEVIVVWECQTRDLAHLMRKLETSLTNCADVGLSVYTPAS